MMTMPKDSLVARIEARFGAGREWTPPSGLPAVVWETRAYHLVCPGGSLGEAELRKLWEARKGRQAHPLVLLAASDESDKVRVAVMSIPQPQLGR